MKLALEALETSMYPQQKQLQAITALREALAEQPAQQEPFGYGRIWWDAKMFVPTLPSVRDGGWLPLYTSPPAQRKPVCAWRREDDDHMPDTWRSECGVLWTFTDGGPTDNDMKHCCGCGAKLQEQNT